MTTYNTATSDEQWLREKGWKIYSKEGQKKFWESPHDQKVYSTSTAVIAQRIVDQEQEFKLRAQQLLQPEGFDEERWKKFDNWEVDVDELWPPPEKKKTKKKARQSKDKNIKDLGF